MTWLEPQVAQYRERHQLGTTARLALELMLNIAGRRQDAHALGRQHINKENKLSWRPHKTLRSTGKTLTIRIVPQLSEAMDAMPASGELRFLLNDYGKPFASAASFGNKFADWCTGRWLMQCSGSEMMHVSGHSSLRQLQEYLDEVDQERQADAAMDKLIAAEAKTETQIYKPQSQKLQTSAQVIEFKQSDDEDGDPGWIRTSDLPLRRRLLYPLSYGAEPLDGSSADLPGAGASA